MTRTGEGRRARPQDKVAPAPESQPAPASALQSAPYPLTHASRQGFTSRSGGSGLHTVRRSDP